jgi:glycosyltransferase involved in cell wall biosynthesis
MNILYIHNDYGRPSGEEHAAEQIAALLTVRGHTVRWFRRSSAELGRSVTGQVKGFFTGIHNPASAAALDRLLGEGKPDAVLVQNIYPLISPSVFAVLRRRRIPVVMRCPNYRLFCPNGLHLAKGRICERCLGPGREWWCLLRNCEGSYLKSAGYALRNAVARIRGSIIDNVHVFLVQSSFQKEKFIRGGISGDRLEVLPGMVQSEPRADPVPLGDVVTYVGRISPEKGIEEFLGAARLLPEIPFVVAGDERGMPRLRERSSSNVEWLGFLERPALRGLYLRSRMVVVPSRCYEGSPNVLVQAMALGRPAVCSAIGGLPEIIGHGLAGLLAEPGNVADLANSIWSLYFKPELCRRLGQAGQERVRQEYSPEVGYERLMRAFRRAVDLNENRAALRSAPYGVPAGGIRVQTYASTNTDRMDSDSQKPAETL